jgi:hypothetical protein
MIDEMTPLRQAFLVVRATMVCAMLQPDAGMIEIEPNRQVERLTIPLPLGAVSSPAAYQLNVSVAVPAV